MCVCVCIHAHLFAPVPPRQASTGILLLCDVSLGDPYERLQVTAAAIDLWIYSANLV